MQDGSSPDQGMAKVNGTVDKIDTQPVPSADLLGDLLGPLAIEGPPGPTPSEEQNPISGYEAAPNSADALALSTTEDSDAVQVLMLKLNSFRSSWYLIPYACWFSSHLQLFCLYFILICLAIFS